MKKIRKFLILLCSILVAFSLFCMASCSSGEEKKTSLNGKYVSTTYASDGETLRGCELFVIVNADNTVYSIALDEDSLYACPDTSTMMQKGWNVKGYAFLANLTSLTVAEINAFDVEVNETGLPTKINGMDEEWLVGRGQLPNYPGMIDACGMVVLALQNAFASL